MPSIVEYIWLDGAKPTQELRSKSRVIELPEPDKLTLDAFPDWSYDGSSTYQAHGHHSDLILKPACVCKDPLRGEGNYLVLCEVTHPDGTPHKTNSRAILRNVLDAQDYDHEPWIGFEQEYTLFIGRTPLGWPEHGFPKPQGPFYCGVGNEKVFGRDVVEVHTRACMDAGILLYGINAEVMPGQWEFQIGYRGIEGEEVDAVRIADHLWIARWLLHRVAEDFSVTVGFDNKPVKGDWNGAGCHANFSTKEMRDPNGGLAAIEAAIESLKPKHSEHIAVYGHGLAERLTGEHETCSINDFRFGVADRGASVRIPFQVQTRGYGYFEDRRPGANCDPYTVTARIVATINHIDERHLNPVEADSLALN